MRIKWLLLFLIPTLIWSDESIPQCCDIEYCEPTCCERPALLSLGVGIWDVFPRRSHKSQYQVEYKWSASWYGIQPLGTFTFNDQGSLYFSFGFQYDIFLGRYFVLSPSFTPGIYIRNGGKDLGFPLEFRSSLALAFQFKNCNRLGAQFYHISNASLGHRNPGVESLIFFYSIAIW